MSEDAIVLLMMIFFAMAAYIAYLRLFVVRRLNRKIDKFVDSALASQKSMAQVEDRGEVRELRQRLHVLERIAVEKEDSLSRQIDGLRAAER